MYSFLYGCSDSLFYYLLTYLWKGLFLSGWNGMEQIKMIGFSFYGGE